MSDPVEIIIEGKDEASKALADVGDSLEGLGTKASGAGGMVESFGGLLAGVGVGAVAAVGVALAGTAATAVDFASDMQQSQRDLQSSLGLTDEQAADLGGTVRDVFGNNFGSDVQDVTDSLITVRQQMKGLADEDLQRVTENALMVRDVFGTDVAESTNAANTLMQNFGLTSDQAFDFITKGMQSGLDASGDFLDTIGEYSTQFANGGADAAQFFSLLQSGAQGGVLGTDKAADAFKEFRVRIQDGSDATSTALQQLGIDSADLATKMASGQLTAADAFQLVVGKLNEVDDQNVRMQAGVGLLGTQFEDLGTKGALALSLTGTSLESMAGATDNLTVKYGSLADVGAGMWRQMLVAIEPLGAAILQLANAAMPMITSAFAGLKAGIAVVVEFVTANMPMILAQFEGLRAGVIPIINLIRTTISAAFTFIMSFLQSNSTETSSFMTQTWTTIQEIIALATQLITQYVIPAFQQIAAFLVAHSAEINMVLSTAWTVIKTVIETTLGVIKGIIQLALALFKGDWQAAWESIKSIVTTLINGIKTIVTAELNLIMTLWLAMWSDMKMKFQTILDSIVGWVKQTFEGVKNAITSMADGIGSAAASVGSAIVSGITRAITAGVSSIASAARDAAMSALRAAKAALGIGSPSKEFEKLYAETGTGAALGINNSIPTVQSAGAAMGGAALAGAGSTLGGGGAGGITFGAGAIVVNAAAGQNAAEIADMVIARIETLIGGRP